MLLNSWRTKCRKNCMLTHTLLRRISTTKTKKNSRSVPSPYFMSMATFFTPSLKISSLEWTIKIWFPFLKDLIFYLKWNYVTKYPQLLLVKDLHFNLFQDAHCYYIDTYLEMVCGRKYGQSSEFILIPEASNTHARGFVKIVKIGCDTTFTKKNPP